MKLRQLNLQELKTLYDVELRKTFPASELRPYSAMKRMAQERCYFPFGVMGKEDTLLGYAILWGELGVPYLLLDYFGVVAERRNEGLGKQALALLREVFCDYDAILIEVEAADGGEEDELRQRRLDFYLRNGCQLLPYDTDLFGVHFRTLYTSPNGKANQTIAMQFHRCLYQKHIPAELVERYVEIPRDEDARVRPLLDWAEWKKKEKKK